MNAPLPDDEKSVQRFSGWGIAMLKERPTTQYVLASDYDALVAEHTRLREEVARINALAIHLNSGGRDPDEKCYTKRDVEALIAITRAVEKRHG